VFNFTKNNQVDIESLYRIYRENPNVQTDTRKLRAGDLFFALSGPNFDGNAFAAKALELGACYAVVDNAAYATGERTILVPDVLQCLQQLAQYHRRQFRIPFIGITGSNGKTTTKELVAAALRTKYRVYATEGNLNNHIGVPLTLLKIRDDAEVAIIEMGANHMGEIASYCVVAEPTHGIITNCGRAHLEGFGSVEGVRKAKGELYDFLRDHEGTVFLNQDLDYLRQMAKGVPHVVTYGRADATYSGNEAAGAILLHIDLTRPVRAAFGTQLVGGYNFPNVMAAIAVGMHFGAPADAIREALAAYKPDNSRSQFVLRGTNSVILDAYNANPSSMREAILNFARTPLPEKRLWLGGMKEMGQDEYAEHKELVALADQFAWREVILVGKEFQPFAEGRLYFETSVAALEYVRTHTPEHSSILIKGSRGSKMEVLLDGL
jgi:UDP-N-acetylmuramoyl-tripeptide--D-alanyl-D-alanine ligase